MKKKIFMASIVVLILLVCVFGRGIYFYVRYIPDKDYFGEPYEELIHPMSFKDKGQATEIMGMIDDAFTFVGNKDEAVDKFGELSRYSVTDDDSVAEEHNLKLITADLNGNKGYLWFAYTQDAMNSDGQHTHGSSDVLVRAELEKNTQGWIIVDTREHP